MSHIPALLYVPMDFHLFTHTHRGPSGLHVYLYFAFSQDMTSRELLQQRTTLSNGDTAWRESPLILAARQGSIAVLDGVHRLESSTLSALQRWALNKYEVLPSS